jgi:hypothetical protein
MGERRYVALDMATISPSRLLLLLDHVSHNVRRRARRGLKSKEPSALCLESFIIANLVYVSPYSKANRSANLRPYYPDLQILRINPRQYLHIQFGLIWTFLNWPPFISFSSLSRPRPISHSPYPPACNYPSYVRIMPPISTSVRLM